jgi:hypothetical protein
MLSVEDWAEIRRLHRAEGLPIKVIARVLVQTRSLRAVAEFSKQPVFFIVSVPKWLARHPGRDGVVTSEPADYRFGHDLR